MKIRVEIDIELDETDEILTLEQQASFLKDKIKDVCEKENVYVDFDFV